MSTYKENYLVYQCMLNAGQHNYINDNPDSDMANAYFAIKSLFGGDAEHLMINAMEYGMYKPTMLMSIYEAHERGTYEKLWAEGNDEGSAALAESVDRKDLRKHPSLSIGDAIVRLLTGDVHIVLPVGFMQVNVELALQSI
tara:strand:+ start:441 stop:863 length:423 start_codon:yes stop_codon:yes gene_type:complete